MKKFPHPLTSFARNLRKKASDAENRLWFFLRNRNLEGWKFRRQTPIGRYIVDFFCFDKKIVIELDGSQHAENVEYDKKRDDYLSKRGLRVLRFWNNEVFENMDGVLERIREVGLETLPSPDPSQREGK